MSGSTPLRDRLLTPDEGTAGEIGVWLAAMDEVRTRTLRIARGLTREEAAWRPSGVANAIGALLRHIALVEVDWILTDIERGEPLPDDTPALLRLEGAMADPGPCAPDDLLALLAYARGLTRERLGRLPADAAASLRTYESGEERRTFSVRWILAHLCDHESHHAGQIALLRAMHARVREERG